MKADDEWIKTMHSGSSFQLTVVKYNVCAKKMMIVLCKGIM
jgi:hypothetical protein